MIASRLLATGQSLQYWLRCFLFYIIASHGKTNVLLSFDSLQTLFSTTITYTIVAYTIITYQNLMIDAISKYCSRLF